MSSEPIIAARNLGKCYQLYAKPQDRLKQFLARGRRQYFREFWALREVNFDIMPGEVIGIVGRNGAGKSTLLQLSCNTLTPTAGEIAVNGRIAALLELGAGFNPEFTGRENVFMSAAIMGIPEAEIAARYDEIVDFSGIRDFIDQPVKTYSSGMYVRLAFAVATSVDPDILVIDEALSVGDGEFARKSFDRIMALKDSGKTILFCSHALYQVQALSDRVMWVADGEARALGAAQEVLAQYEGYLAGLGGQVAPGEVSQPVLQPPSGTARLRKVDVSVDGQSAQKQTLISGEATVHIAVDFDSDPAMSAPNVAIGFVGENGQFVTSVSTFFDRQTIDRDGQGHGRAVVELPAFPLLKGRYSVDVYLMCEKGVFVYDSAVGAAELKMEQRCLTQGVVSVPHSWVDGVQAR